MKGRKKPSLERRGGEPLAFRFGLCAGCRVTGSEEKVGTLAHARGYDFPGDLDQNWVSQQKQRAVLEYTLLAAQSSPARPLSSAKCVIRRRGRMDGRTLTHRLSYRRKNIGDCAFAPESPSRCGPPASVVGKNTDDRLAMRPTFT